MDVIRAHPDSLANIEPKSDLDKELLNSIQWGFALHPDEADNTQPLVIPKGATIDWSEKDGCEDVTQYVRQATVPPRYPIAGVAEHVISLRRFVNSQEPDVREGDAWQHGTATHLKTIFQPG
jgi:NADPH-dependent ferric siderophore reductase